MQKRPNLFRASTSVKESAGRWIGNKEEDEDDVEDDDEEEEEEEEEEAEAQERERELRRRQPGPIFFEICNGP